MNREAFVAKFAEILEVPPETVTESYALDGGNWESVAVMATIALIDAEYDITIPGKDLIKCRSVKELVDLIADRVDHNPAG